MAQDLANRADAPEVFLVRGVPFPPTRHSVLGALHSPDAGVRARALATVAEGYWRPVCSYVQMRWGYSRQDAEDTTQSFFSRALSSRLLERYDPAKARFRTYLRVCLDGHVANERTAARRLKRGGGAVSVPLETDAPELIAPDAVDAIFEREWVRGLCADALAELRDRLQRRNREIVFQIFERYDVFGAEEGLRPTYAALAGDFMIPVSQVTNHLSAARREFREVVLERLRRLTVDAAEFRAEAQALLGTDLPGASL
jgi:RNA polymerase sigma factor (sigma-70 family)